MQRKIDSCFLCGLILLFSITSCTDDQPLTSGPLHSPRQSQDDQTTGGPKLPSSVFDYSSTSQFSNEIVTLGRVLFYDKTLSVNGSVSCASCHKQAASFA